MAKDKVKKPRKVYSKDDNGKRERFRDFANARVPRVIRSLRGIARLANKSSYLSTTEQAQKILMALATEYNRVKDAFEHGAAQKDESWKL